MAALLLKLSGPHEMDSEFSIFLMPWNTLSRNRVFLKGLIALSHKTIWALCLSLDFLQPSQGASEMMWERGTWGGAINNYDAWPYSVGRGMQQCPGQDLGPWKREIGFSSEGSGISLTIINTSVFL